MVQSGVKLDSKVAPLFLLCGKDKAEGNAGFKLVINKQGKFDQVQIDEDSILPHNHEKPLHAMFLDAGLKAEEPCYMVVCCKGVDSEGKELNKILFITWVSDEAPIKKRMLYSSSQEFLIKKLGATKTLEVHSHEEISIDGVLQKLCSGTGAKPAVSFEGRPVAEDENTKTYNFTD
jgi:hypothetical protein